MESNGVRGKIHVSQQTADELIAHGKSSWLTPREDKIIAKGKGELQTYFVTVVGAKTVASKSTAGDTVDSDDEDPVDEIRV